jgi:PAS domain S-box-containing protein
MKSVFNILFIGDCRDECSLSEILLSREFEDMTLTGIHDATAFARAIKKGGFHIALIDVVLSWSDVHDVVQTLRDIYPLCPIVMFHDPADADTAINAARQGVNDFIPKTVSGFLQVPAVIRKVIEQSRSKASALQISDAFPLPAISLNASGIVLNSNRSAAQVLGYDSAASLKGVSLPKLFTQKRDRENLLQWIEQQDSATCRSFQVQRPDGSTRWISLAGISREEQQGKSQDFQGILLDTTGEKDAETELRDALQKKDTLIKEIFHRVKNNFQMVSSLLNLQADHTKDPEMIELMKKCRNRIQSMALIHEKLLQSEENTEISFPNYVQDMVSHLFTSYGVGPESISYHAEIDEIPLGLESIIPLSLIINELVTNSLKHAFPNGKKGEIYINLEPCNSGKLRLSVKDNGIGLPPEINIRNSHTLGLQLVALLAEQLDGHIGISRDGGTELSVTLPVETRKQGD